PPLSPFGLLEELLWYDPWRLLMACIMLNQTSRRQVDPVLAQFLDTHPTPESAAKADPTALAPMLKPLGLNKKRPVAVVRFSREYLAWRSGRALHWVGQYGVDAYDIFVLQKWETVTPDDSVLRCYVDW
ncbi:DNA glycosylase, partial [Tribonema minus]